ncbi:peptidoglycan bridge formation glycyltransferase FemA/FemB family protein [uncultured Sphaerochaeta sp.]|uniref:lipid II:glycine glycyltransferase FemX n=1 Tax=uncultured Sphaerochaeta sp. TaxID=886478 RepID=UPI002A0A4B7E|nr:peptidoglycan bridge formation glycyltransferase FemA/FemB family protein [uncultured Sphaerochaeta sp.]
MVELKRIDYKKFPCTFSPFQSSFWGAVKHASGWNAHAFLLDVGSWHSQVLVLVRQLAPFCSLAYIPFGPDVFNCPTLGVSQLIKELSKQLKKQLPWTVFSIRYDLPWDEVNDPNVMKLEGKRFHTSKESVQPDGTVRVDLHWGYEAVTCGYRDRAKRAIRKSSQFVDVCLWDGDVKEFKRWYNVYLETARRDGFSARTSKYLKALLALDSKVAGDVKCKLILAKHEGVIIGGCIVLMSSFEAVYLFGASLRQDNFTCSHAMQDFAIRLACENGCTYYDFFGIPGPMGRGMHLKGLELFKLSFGGQPYYRTPTTDYVTNFLVWKIYSISENARYRLKRHAWSQEGCLPSS